MAFHEQELSKLSTSDSEAIRAVSSLFRTIFELDKRPRTPLTFVDYSQPKELDDGEKADDCADSDPVSDVRTEK